jgi:hypothetical protein
MRVLALSAALTLCALLASIASSAQAAPLQLQWTQVKVYESPQVTPNTNRTWLGYLTRSGCGPGCAAGTVTPSAGLAGPTVAPSAMSSPELSYTWSFGASTGSITGATDNPAALSGTVDFAGTLTFDSPAPPAGHGLKIAISNPRVVLNGDGTGKLFASGAGLDPSKSGGTDYSSYSNLELFELDTSAARANPNFDGSTTITGIVPKLKAAGFFSPPYAVDSGPDRVPNTFGTFSIVIPAPEVVEPVVEPTAKTKTFKVKSKKKSLFKTKKSVAVKVTLNKKTVGYATVRGKKVKVTYFTSTFAKGTYRLTPLTAKFKSISLKLG